MLRSYYLRLRQHALCRFQSGSDLFQTLLMPDDPLGNFVKLTIGFRIVPSVKICLLLALDCSSLIRFLRMPAENSEEQQ
jgi:hypothetical protein